MDTPAVTSPAFGFSSFSEMAAKATSFVKAEGEALVTTFLPSRGQAGKAAAGAVTAAGVATQSIGDSVAKTVESAGTGVKTGFEIGVFAIVLLLGLYLLGLFRNATR